VKKRSGFVSNSSSASFIVKFHTDKSREELEGMIRKSNVWLDKRWDKTEIEEYDWSRFKSGGTKDLPKKMVEVEPEKDKFLKGQEKEFEIHPETSMFNDWTDVPGWVFIRAIDEGRIPDVFLDEIIQTEDEYNDVNEPVDFDITTWEYQEYVENPTVNPTDEDVKKALETQRQRDVEYLLYLSKIGVPLSDEETIFIAKHKLSEKNKR
jgi:hypothetical protein